jgi:hypothetical protein
LSNSPRNRPFGYRFLKATCRLSFYIRFYSFLQYKPFSSLVSVLPEGAIDQEVDGSVQHEEQVIEPEINILGNLWLQIFIKLSRKKSDWSPTRWDTGTRLESPDRPDTCKINFCTYFSRPFHSARKLFVLCLLLQVLWRLPAPPPIPSTKNKDKDEVGW